MHKSVLTWLFTCLSLAAQSGSTGSVQGTVTTEAGKAIAGALVTAVGIGLPPRSQTAQSAADGSFTVKGLPAGSYSLCVQIPGDGYLDPCIWTTTAPSVTLASGQASAGNILKIKAGSLLKIRIDDPSKLATQKTPSGANPYILMGVSVPGKAFHPVHLKGSDASGSDYQVTIPRDTPLVFSIQSPNLRLSDSKGAALPNNTTKETVNHDSADPNPKSLSYKISGVIP